jgi:deoxyribodipyrimidine photo-lyase
MTARQLPIPSSDVQGVRDWVAKHLGHVSTAHSDPRRDAPSAIRGGQGAADAALAHFEVRGYARRRNNVWPTKSQGASRLSPYIRHGLLSLQEVWDRVADGPEDDVVKFRDELLWQEYARHLYARVGAASGESLRFEVDERSAQPAVDVSDHPWSSSALCVESAWQELTEMGWLTNQQRMWLASHWSIREGARWRDGEDLMYRHLLDGSRAANRLGWQWTIGALTGKPYGFSRWQVEKRAPGLCSSCPLERNCPIAEWPSAAEREPKPFTDDRLRHIDDLNEISGPRTWEQSGDPEYVWITAESLGMADPASVCAPDVPLIFVFDEPLLGRLKLGAGRLWFLVETLAEMAENRDVEVWLGNPIEVLSGRRLAATFAPVPGWRARAAQLDLVGIAPWPWLQWPKVGSVTSYTAWRRTRR